jgi:DNA topoisomerase-1
MIRDVARLKRVDCSEAGITRRRRGRGFEFLDADHNRIDDADELARIRDLAIPPAWDDVWICVNPNGHLQATGIDAARAQAVPRPPALASEARPAEVR